MKARPQRLDNGLTLLTATSRAVPVVALSTWYGVGSRDEQTGESGVAHFLEHMMFRGSARFQRGEIDRITQLAGGSNNAYTTCDATVYTFDLPARGLDAALRIEADRMRRLRLDPEDFEAERTIILDEIRSALDLPEQRLLLEADRLTFPDHPYGHPILGWAADIEALPLARLRTFYDTHYRPDNAALVVVGDLDERAVAARVCELFDAIEPVPRPAATPCAFAPARSHRKILAEEVQVPRFYMQFRGIDARDPREPVLDCLAYLLAPNRNSLLFVRLVRELGAAAAVHAENDSRKEPGVFWIEVEGAPGADPERIEEAVHAELSRLAREGPQPPSLKRAIHALKADHLFRLEAPADIAEELGDAAMVASYEALDTYVARLEAVAPADVARACREFCDPDSAVAVWSVPA